MVKQVTKQERKLTGCGYIRMIEHDNGSLALNLGKNGSCAHTFVSALRETLNEIYELGGRESLEKMAVKLGGTECFKGKCCIDIIADFLRGKYE